MKTVEIANAEKHNSHKINNTDANKEEHSDLRGSPKCWATSTKHRYRSSYYSANGDYRRILILTLLSHTLSLYGHTIK